MTNSYPVLVISPDTVNEVISWARQAGQIALGYFKNVTPELKPDNTFLTKADLEIERYLGEQIRGTFPDHHMIGEEGTRDKNRAHSPNVWAVDPIDGTTAFVQGLPGWGISIGLLHQGQPHFGLFYMPLLDDLTYTTAHGDVYCNGRNLKGRLRSDWADKGFLAIASTSHADFTIKVRRTRALGSIAVNLVYTARGTATATFAPKANLWDVAAGAAILLRVGGELRYLSGRPVDYQQLLSGRLAPEPIIAGHPLVLEDLIEKIRSRRRE